MPQKIAVVKTPLSVYKVNFFELFFMEFKNEIAIIQQQATQSNVGVIRRQAILNELNIQKGQTIIDIGCGGGLLSEPMSRLGAEVTGIDASEKNIQVAKLHAKKNNLKINYLTASPENLKTDRKFDVILNMEIIEHVEDVDIFLKSCSSLLKKEGIMFVATINKTLKSYLFAIIGAEYILRWLPIGTHEWDKFIDPNDLIKISKKYNLQLQNLDGMKFNIITDKWSISSDKSINYIGKFNKV